MPKSPPNDKALQTTSSANVSALQRAKSLLKLTESILGGGSSLTVRNAWVDELIAWADENGISEKYFPRNADEILGLEQLDWPFHKLSHPPDSIGNLTNLISGNWKI